MRARTRVVRVIPRIVLLVLLREDLLFLLLFLDVLVGHALRCLLIV